MVRYRGTPSNRKAEYDPFAPAKRREREHQIAVKNRRAGLPFDLGTNTPPPAFQSMDAGGVNKNIYNPNDMTPKQREKFLNQRAWRRRLRYQGAPPKVRKPLEKTHNKRAGPVPYKAP